MTADPKDGSLAAAAVNKDPDAEQTLELCFLDKAPQKIRIHTLNGPSPDSYNDVGRTEVGVTVSDWTPFSGTVALLPHSVNVLEFA